MRRRQAAGSVTVFFSFILFLLISLVLVSVESARQQAAVSMLQTDLSLALSSLQGQYYAPLFDEFDLYALYQEDAERSLYDYLKGSADPLSDLPEGYSGSTSSGYSFACENLSVTVEQKYALTDAGGEFLRRQMITAGAVSGADALIEELLSVIGFLKDQEPGLRLLKEQAKTQEKLSAMDTLLLELIPYLDGVPTNASGILCDEEGKIIPHRYHAKNLTTTEPSREAVGIDSFAVYLYLQPYYVNIAELLQKEREERAEYEETLPEDGGSEWQARKAGLIIHHIQETLPKTRKALGILSDLKMLQTEVGPLLAEYEEKLSQYEGLLSKEWEEALSESVAAMKKYIGDTGEYYDYEAMYERLSENNRILEEVLSVLTEYRDGTAEDWEECLSKAEEALQGYSLDGLSIRYVGMHRGTAVEDGFLKAVKNFLVEGLTSGIIDSSVLSSKTLPSTNQPSLLMRTSVYDAFDLDLPDDASEINGSTLWRIIRNWDIDKLTELLEGALESLLEKVLLVSYDRTHFSDYSHPDGNGVLEYQIEYLLFGKQNDADNLRRAALSVLGIRFVMNLVHTLTDPGKKGTALATATEIFGACFPFLITACQYIILIAWAVQNAKLETVEILKGKKVPFVVTKDSFQIPYGEILTMNKEKRFQRADAYKDDAVKAAPKYDIYLMAFLMLHKEDVILYRSMDLIQETMQRRYDGKFLLSACLCGVAVSVSASIPGRYTAVPVSENGLNGRLINISGACLY